MYEFNCIHCGILYKLYEVENNRYRCWICGNVLYPSHIDLISDSSFDRICTESFSLSEGETPMFEHEDLTKNVGCKRLLIKNESMNPTGSFKDRGSVFEIVKAIQYGKKEIVLASTGNMAASMAAYCAYANLICNIYMPKSTSINKIKQIEAYGAFIRQINGNYNDCLKRAEIFAENWKDQVFLAGDYFWRMIGMMSLGFELIKYRPDVVFVPYGNGNLLYSIYLAFKSRENMYSKMPTFIAVEAERNNTDASAVDVQEPLQKYGVFKILDETNGFILKVKDNDIRKAKDQLAKKGLFLELGGALSYAGALKTYVDKNSIVICIGSGSGFKDL